MEKKVVSSVQNYQNYFQTKFFNLLIAIDTPHVPKLESISSLLDLLTLCFLVIASNFLDPRTYQYPCDIPSDDDIKKMKLFDLNDIDAADRRRHSYARGLAWKITRWCEDNFEIYATNSSEQLSMHDLTITYFATLAKKILAYKSIVQAAKMQGVPHCNHIILHQQIAYCFERTEVKTLFDEIPINSENVEDLDYRIPPKYNIRRRHPSTINSHSTFSLSFKKKFLNIRIHFVTAINTNPFLDGTTIADEKYWKGYECGFQLNTDILDDENDDYIVVKRKQRIQV